MLSPAPGHSKVPYHRTPSPRHAGVRVVSAFPFFPRSWAEFHLPTNGNVLGIHSISLLPAETPQKKQAIMVLQRSTLLCFSKAHKLARHAGVPNSFSFNPFRYWPRAYIMCARGEILQVSLSNYCFSQDCSPVPMVAHCRWLTLRQRRQQ